MVSQHQLHNLNLITAHAPVSIHRVLFVLLILYEFLVFSQSGGTISYR